jgi:low temperature requirement protein LtrA
VTQTVTPAPPQPVGSRGIRVRMQARPTDESHRVSSNLELLFDLTFVVAVASITAQLAHGIEGGHGRDVFTPFLQVFFAIWWAWMNFTWFASSYDTDDVPYRLMTLVQMAGVLVLAAGVPSAVTNTDYRTVTIGYLIMRAGLIGQWLRVAKEDPHSRSLALRYAGGIALVQVGWVLRLILAETHVLPYGSLLPIFVGLVIAELAVPPFAEHIVSTSWHPHHISERYGLFTIILLGESVLASSEGVDRAVGDKGLSASLVTLAIAALVLLFALWWLYFYEPVAGGLAERRERSYLWGYGHYGIFAALAALGAGLEVAVRQAGERDAVSAIVVAYAVAIPVAVFLVLLWALSALLVSRPATRPAVILTAAAVILLLPLGAPSWGSAPSVAAIAGVCALACAVTIVLGGATDKSHQGLTTGG